MTWTNDPSRHARIEKSTKRTAVAMAVGVRLRRVFTVDVLTVIAASGLTWVRAAAILHAVDATAEHWRDVAALEPNRVPELVCPVSSNLRFALHPMEHIVILKRAQQ